jgi:Uma2 family endonuclease
VIYSARLDAEAYSLVMGSSTQGLTVAEALALPEDPLEEIVHGEVRKMPPPDNAHAALIEELYDILSEQLQKERYRIRTTAYGLGIRTEPALAVRNPDLTVFDRGELKTARGYVWTAPHLVVECLSPSNRKGSIHQL